jgi:hypothetical protein
MEKTMQLKRLLLTTTSLCMLSLVPLTALGQDAGLTAAYNAYVEAQSGDDADAKAAAEAAFLAECQRIGAPDLQQCIAIATGAATVEPPLLSQRLLQSSRLLLNSPHSLRRSNLPLPRRSPQLPLNSRRPAIRR